MFDWVLNTSLSSVQKGWDISTKVKKIKEMLLQKTRCFIYERKRKNANKNISFINDMNTRSNIKHKR